MNRFSMIFWLMVLVAGWPGQTLGTGKEEKEAIKAIRTGNIEILKSYLESNPDANCIFSNGKTGLYYAILYDQTRISEYLLQGGADPNFILDDYTTLEWAIRYDRARIARLLIEYGAEVNHTDELQNTPLIYAAELDNAEMCRILVERGANPLRKNQAGRRASSYAGTYPNSSAYQYLLEMEAFCRSTDSVPDLKDGPYFFWESDDRIVMRYFEREQEIKRTRLREKTLEIKQADTLIAGFGGDRNSYQVRQEMSPDPSEIVTNGDIFAIGDVHGRYDALVNLLKNNRIIDPELKWIFGDGHLVMLGDVFDRGSQVTETLWFLYHLQIQAREAGGNVHLLLGNHEIMAMTGDQRYLHDKYAFFARFTQSRYAWFYEKNTLLGQWLRSQNLILRINGNLFLHAGIAPQFAIHNLSLDEINARTRAYLHSDYKLQKGSPEHLILGPIGPQWYRGYSEQSDKFPELTQEFIDSYLEAYNLDRMILGHNEQEEITASFSGKVISCDVAIDQSGASAQGLLISGEEIVKCYADGRRERME